jgi:hypothetical protein
MSNAAPAPGETSLSTLLSTLTTTLHDPTYVFITIPPASSLPSLPQNEIQLLFRESEGTTIITTLETANSRNLEYSFPCKMITLNVQSSLEAVGFMAVIATRLAGSGMGVNPVSGFWHDHLFVPVGREVEAVRVLAELAEEKRMEVEGNGRKMVER